MAMQGGFDDAAFIQIPEHGGRDAELRVLGKGGVKAGHESNRGTGRGGLDAPGKLFLERDRPTRSQAPGMKRAGKFHDVNRAELRRSSGGESPDASPVA